MSWHRLEEMLVNPSILGIFITVSLFPCVLMYFLLSTALKADRKRLKAEKFDLINQMKQLYATLEDKEKELRDFIRNYEQVLSESLAKVA